MSQEINNQTTLFRFVSLRSAELTKKENQDKRFIFHPDNQTGIFFEVLKEKKENETKWKHLQIASEDFTAFTDEKQIEVLDKDFFQIANWISQNTGQIDLKIIALKCKNLSSLDDTIELKLWDNLFYQIITQKSFYVKEAVIEMLVLNNILKNKVFFDDVSTNDALIRQMLSAKVVLPPLLFEDLLKQTHNATAEKFTKKEPELAGFVHQALLTAQEVESAKIKAKNLESLLANLKKIEQKHSQ